MSPEQVENVAKALFGTEHDGEWSEASESLRIHYIHLARTAVLLIAEAPATSRLPGKAKAVPHMKRAGLLPKHNA